jgi:murein DD-endopeptidase MepM/ murein hydrolase activator NlpD
MSGRAFLLLHFILFVFVAHGQNKFDPHYFSYPLDIKAKFNANFGEMRPNHFHMGLDLSTESRQNLPIYAPADGFISRIKIEEGGFGRALYIEHPNGLTTLYAHMNRFIPAAEQYLRSKQYERQTWKIDLNVPSDILKVKKGDLIGYSGNTGASAGPHVHFEIRDTKNENCFNPLKFDFGVIDNIPPTLIRLAFYDRDKSVYEQSPIIVPMIKTAVGYKPASTIALPFTRAFIGILALDRINGAANQYGIYKAALLKNQEVITSFEMENIGYDKTRFQNGHIDYISRFKGGPYYQMLFPSTYYNVDMYFLSNAKKCIELNSAEQTYDVQVSDAAGNSTSASFNILSTGLSQPSFVIPGQRIIPGNVNVFEDEMLRVVFNEDAFYDAFNFNYKATYQVMGDQLSSIYQLLPEYIPVQSYFSIAIKPNKPMVLINAERVIMRRTFRGKVEVKKALKEKDMFAASFRDFGNFQLLEDQAAPTISANIPASGIILAGRSIVVNVSDNYHLIRNFKATIDGNWVMFSPSGNRFSYYPDEHFTPGEHKLEVFVMDEAGNEASKVWMTKR